MAGNVKKTFRLLRLYAKMDLEWILQDTRAVIIILLSETVSNLCSMAGILLLAVRFGGIGGFNADQMLFMMGFFELGGGLCSMLFGNFNVMHISRRVGRGQMDHMLLQPVPLLSQILSEGFMPFSGSGQLLLGIVLTVFSLCRLQLTLTVTWFLLLCYYLIVHTALLLGQSFIYGSLAFSRPVAAEEISTMILDVNSELGRFPLFSLPRPLAGILCTVLPSGLLAWFPSMVLLGQMDLTVSLTLPFVVSTLFVLTAVTVFRKGLKYYEKNSCNRFKDMGFRR